MKIIQNITMKTVQQNSRKETGNGNLHQDIALLTCPGFYFGLNKNKIIQFILMSDSELKVIQSNDNESSKIDGSYFI